MTTGSSVHANDGSGSGKPLTGRRVLAYTLIAFGVVVGANMALLFSAIGSFPGLEVRNSYVASQTFDTERKSQEALGWSVDLSFPEDQLAISITGPDGKPVVPAGLSAQLGRATHNKSDQLLELVLQGDRFLATTSIAPGRWTLWIAAQSVEGTAFRQRLTFMKPDLS